MKFDWEKDWVFKQPEDMTLEELSFLSGEVDEKIFLPTQEKKKLKLENKVDTETQKRKTSYEVFCKYATRFDSYFQSEILGENCYKDWVSTRKKKPKQPELSFRKALIAHAGGKDGRKPFPEKIEKIILEQIRTPQIWPCFKNSADKKVLNIGCKRFRGSGYHETRERKKDGLKQSFVRPKDPDNLVEQIDNLFDILQKEGEF
eukprot:snap_masked-scaffold_86-processed-gene-0.3-mRNA-1 protein AED:1.00 eAED:1.00 QI:0/-1/0/0/-1/1/1/0/202